MPRNDVLINKVLDYIEVHPEEWDQGSWFCETTACFAGHTLLQSGYRVAMDAISGEFKMTDPLGSLVDDGKIADVATELLGIPRTQAREIFNSMVTDIEDLRGLIRCICNQLDTGTRSCICEK